MKIPTTCVQYCSNLLSNSYELLAKICTRFQDKYLRATNTSPGSSPNRLHEYISPRDPPHRPHEQRLARAAQRAARRPTLACATPRRPRLQCQHQTIRLCLYGRKFAGARAPRAAARIRRAPRERAALPPARAGALPRSHGAAAARGRRPRAR